MRAPPAAVKIASGAESATAVSAALSVAFPTATPMEPPRNEKSCAAMTVSIPPNLPCATSIASEAPVFTRASRIRSEYRFTSRNRSGSSGASSTGRVSNSPSSKMEAKRPVGGSGMWCPQAEHTASAFTSSRWKIIWPQESHLDQRCSGTEECRPRTALSLGRTKSRIQFMGLCCALPECLRRATAHRRAPRRWIGPCRCDRRSPSRRPRRPRSGRFPQHAQGSGRRNRRKRADPSPTETRVTAAATSWLSGAAPPVMPVIET